MLTLALITAGLLGLFLVLFGWLTRRLKKDFDLIISFLAGAAHSNDLINRDRVQFSEVDRMTESANQMLTDRRDAGEALRRSEQKYRGLIESTAGWIWEVNAEGVFTYVSPQVESILGYTPHEIVGKTPFNLMPPEESRQVEVFFRDMKARGQGATAFENVHLHKNGSHVTLETSGTPVFDEAGNVIGHRGISRDIAERKVAEESLQKIARLESVGTLAGGIAHDFNNILMGLFGNISLAKSALPDDHPDIENLEEAEKAMPNGGHLYVTLENAEIAAQELPTLVPGRYVKITMRDEGTGMDPELVGRIFDPYFSTKKTGSGLGLAITYSIVRKHGGHIDVVSRPGAGTTFSLYLPASEAEHAVEFEMDEAQAPLEGKTNRVLVMDDDAMVRDVVVAMLKIDPGATCIVSSGYTDDPVMANYGAYGFKGIISKPYTLVKLRESLRQVLSDHVG